MSRNDARADVPALDGRASRSARSREAIVRALVELVGRGVLQPTAQQVADEARVGIRSVFRHFSEMEGLYAAMDGQLEGSVRHLLSEPRTTGTVAERVRALVGGRATLFERVAPYKRSANLLRWRSAFLQERHVRMRRLLRADLLAWFPELAEAPAAVVDGIDHVTSFESWDALRSDQGLGPRRVVDVLERTVTALLESARSRARA